MMVSYRLDGLLSFNSGMHSFAVNDSKTSTLKIPFINTLKVPSEDLIVETSGALSGVVGVAASDSNGSTVTLEVDPKMATDIGAAGTLRLSSPLEQKTADTRVILYLDPPARLSPRTLRFRETDDGEFVSSAVLRVKAESGEAEKKTSAQTAYFEATLAGKKLRVSTKQLGNGIFRLELKIPSKVHKSLLELERPATSMKWSAMAYDKRFSGQCFVTFSR